MGVLHYRLRLPEELAGMHDTFHVSNLKKCLAKDGLHVPIDEIKIDKTLCFVEEPVEIIDREVKSLKRSRIPIVKVRWNFKRGPEFTWEREEYMKSKYPQLFVDRVVRLNVKLKPDEWIKDSGCSRHMTGNKDLFSSYKAIDGDNTLFTKKKNPHIIIVQIYVDDIIFGLTCQDLCDDFSKIMHDEFEMSMMGELNFFLGLHIKQLEDDIFFNQSKYIKEMLKKFGLEDSKPIKTPMSSETKLTRDEDEESVDNTKLCIPKNRGRNIIYPDSDHAGDYVNCKSTSDVCTFMGCCLTLWFSKKQTALAISTTKAEYVSAEKASQQALWMKQALVDYDIVLDDIHVLCDNKGAIDLSKNPILHYRTKHIEIRHHFLRDNVQKGNISIEKVSFEDNIADILTKPLKREPFNLLRLGLGLMEPNT
ncbi:retrovirus-related pol polyprotein from transposon TNT 1-94 [Tanacetum coccineum]|uniref:Retrovirus-related pol polyprotein from transposon TNT 1-94 n=1 Tax=Tanacetum coccineum TaxID=301880 RepID=A0ABQ5FYU0_9ASTR